METKFKTAAIAVMLDEQWHWSLKGNFLQLSPMSHQKIRPVDPALCEKINGNQAQECGHSDHLG
jgi:hypothetical protein